MSDAFTPAFGWVRDDAAVAAVQATLPFKTFAATPAWLAGGAGEPDQVFLWQAALKATGALLPARNQKSVGSCVGFGTNRAVETLMCVEIALKNEAEEFKETAPEVTYGGSRVEVGGGRISGDGSVGAWAAEFVKRWGIVARGVYGPLDVTRYDETTCRMLGRNGLTTDLEAIARQHPVQEFTQVRTPAECRSALANGYPVQVCSRIGFQMRRDADGFLKRSGSWGHCQAILGYTNTGRKGFFIDNSWGQDPYGGGNLGPGGPPASGAWVDEEVVADMLAENDSWAFSSLAGWPGRAKQLDWLI